MPHDATARSSSATLSFRRLNSDREGALFVADDRGPLMAQAPPELDQLIGPRRGLSQLHEESLHGDEHFRDRSTSHTARDERRPTPRGLPAQDPGDPSARSSGE